MNRFALSATLVERSAMRYTPAGLPALDVQLAHESEVSEDGQPRKVSLEMKALVIGALTQPLNVLALGCGGLFAGFITHTRNRKGLLFHITSFEPVESSAPSRAVNTAADENPAIRIDSI